MTVVAKIKWGEVFGCGICFKEPCYLFLGLLFVSLCDITSFS